ncbi:hypothetical protein G7076_05810 [Sphingomonas sp. HDW15A]|nr:hypothetical protein [Sphingomonas sp. HDW15A]QIK96033.1 hypothetical protein G7076_05810 [Sphingomonas sp. HDW15A]
MAIGELRCAAQLAIFPRSLPKLTAIVAKCLTLDPLNTFGPANVLT